MSKDGVSVAQPLSGRALARAIFDCDVPEEMIKNLPTQSLYYAVIENGLESSGELLRLITPAQQQALLDFDCWEKDSFREDRFWTWLEVAAEDEDQVLFKKLIASLDLKLVALIISRYVDVTTNEEPTDAPPAAHHYTPDRGYTWLGLRTEDTEKERLLGRLLAYLFESNADLFYKLIQIPSVETGAVLEEESFQDRERRVQAEGIPSNDAAFEVTAPLKPAAATAQLLAQKLVIIPTEYSSIDPIIAGRLFLEPLQTVLSKVGGYDEIKAELSFLMNSLIVRFNIPFYEDDVVTMLRDKMFGAINIGIEKLQELSKLPAEEVIARGGFRTALRTGLWCLQDLKSKVVAASQPVLDLIPTDSKLFLAVAGLRETIPAAPQFFDSSLDFLAVNTPIEQGWKAFQHDSELQAMNSYIIDGLLKLKN